MVPLISQYQPGLYFEWNTVHVNSLLCLSINFAVQCIFNSLNDYAVVA